jgi:hypothetical protein
MVWRNELRKMGDKRLFTGLGMACIGAGLIIASG